MSENNTKIDEIVAILSRQPDLEFGEWHGEIPEIENSAESTKLLIELVRRDQESRLDDPKVAPYAWRLLSVRRSREAIPALIDYLLSADDEDDFSLEDIPRCLAKFGTNALPLLFESLFDEQFHAADLWGFAGLISTIEGIGDANASAVTQICEKLSSRLSSYQTSHPSFNAFVINALAHFHHDSATEAIKRVFAEDFVDTDIADWRWISEKIPSLSGTDQPQSKGQRFGEVPRYIGDSKYQELLWAIGAETRVDEVRLFLLGTVLALEVVPPSKIFAEIFCDFDGEELEFVTRGQASLAMTQTMSLLNELTKYQNEPYIISNVDPKIASEPEFVKRPEVLSKLKAFLLICRMENFLFGLSLGVTELENPGSEDGKIFLSHLSEKLFHIKSMHGDDQFTDYQHLDALVGEFVSFWNASYLQFTRACQNARMRLFEKRRFVQEHRHMGRNDQCPCGSGRKFKKCCLQVAKRSLSLA